VAATRTEEAEDPAIWIALAMTRRHDVLGDIAAVLARVHAGRRGVVPNGRRSGPGLPRSASRTHTASASPNSGHA